MTFIATNARLIKVGQVAEILGIGTSTVWKYSKQNAGFPQPLSISARNTRWRLSDVEKFVDAKADSIH
ncbi:AlpA family phage regulatory protein [Undibacterium jejuense]|uniref:AlpA family phage regulatory protein n=1 Tax=Undibacterium jejuense TaxID=1344949 RepID=A0A923HJX0_9BURK|nr:AlpA family phage regulatory protein [Undibacterium jejuense]MBC3862174.1 AlpA family phage regulatory protein [Undibacterium jejuense]